MYDVSTGYQQFAQQKNAKWQRKLLLGTSDYSNFVIAWPTIGKKWNDLRSQTVTIELSNEGKTFNFLAATPTKMRSIASVSLSPVPTTQSMYVGAQAATIRSLAFSADGTSAYTTVSVPGTIINQYSLSIAWNISTGAYADKSLNVGAQVSAIYGVAFSADGTSVYVTDLNNVTIFQYTLSTAWDISTGTYASKSLIVSAQGSDPRSLAFSTDGTKVYVVFNSNDTIFQYTLSTAWDISTGTYASKSLGVYSAYATTAVELSADGTKAYSTGYGVAGNDTIFQHILSTAWDISTGTYASKSLYVGAQLSDIAGIDFSADGTKIYVADQSTKTIFQYTLSTAWDISTGTYASTAEYITVFAGTIDAARFQNGTCSLTLMDKLRMLSDRKIGDTTSPVSYTASSYLVHDMAWYACTSLGGLSAVVNSSNPDLDYPSFTSWTSIFSADNVRVQAHLTGQQPIEVLRKLALLTQSAIYVENDKIKFTRFSLAGAQVTTLDNTGVIDATATLDDRELINKSWVSGAYDVTSRKFGLTVYDQSSQSQSDYGLREKLVAENFVWLPDSLSALNLAQRTIIAQENVRNKYQVKSALQAILTTIGDTVYFQDPFLDVSDTFRVMGESINTNTGQKTFDIDQTQYFSVFRLDVSALDSSDVLS